MSLADKNKWILMRKFSNQQISENGEDDDGDDG
jgi:hypothetical protein